MNEQCYGCYFSDICKSKTDSFCDAYHSLTNSLYPSDEDEEIIKDKKREFYSEWFSYLDGFYS